MDWRARQAHLVLEGSGSFVYIKVRGQTREPRLCYGTQDLTVAAALLIPFLPTTVYATTSCNSRFLLPDAPRRGRQHLCPWPPAWECGQWLRHGPFSSPSLLGVIFFPSILLHMLNLYPKGWPRLFGKKMAPDGLVPCCDLSQTPTQPDNFCSHYYSLQHATPLRWQVVSVAASSCQSESLASLLELLQALAFTTAAKEGKVCLFYRVAVKIR